MPVKRKHKKETVVVAEPTAGDFTQKSDRHLCWASHQPTGSGGVAMHALEDPSKVNPSEAWEFFYRMEGSMGKTPTVYKARVVCPVTVDRDSRWIPGRARHKNHVISNGVWWVKELIRRLGCRMPEDIAEAQEEPNTAVGSGALPGSTSNANRRKSTMAGKGKTNGLSVNQAWEQLLLQNEKAPKSKKLTDAQLTVEMEREFPDKAGKSTMTRVSMIRGCYNAGTNLFQSRHGGVRADDKNRPVSHPYDENGEKIENARSRPRKTDGKKTASKKVSKKKVSKKTASKKVSKKKAARA